MTAIVVVDDQAANRLIMSKLASSIVEDAQVTMFANPLMALAYIEHHTPDLLITDYKMKPINGDELIRRFRCVAACADVPIVVITAFEDVDFRDRALRAGSTDFLISPIDHDDFRNRLRCLLAIRGEQDLLQDEAARIARARGAPLALRPADGATEMVEGMLQMVNLHLVATLAELELIRGDFDSALAETQLAAIFFDANMNIRWFTPAILALFGDGAGGLESPLAAIDAKLNYHDLAQDFERMLESGEPVQRYLEAVWGAHYLVKILPNYRADRSITGAAITFTKITSLRGGGG